MRKNVLTMLGTLEECLLSMYRCPEDAVRHLVPSPFELVSYKGNALLGVVVSRLRYMRPWPLPAWMGMSYHHVAYRIYVQYTPPGQAPIQGLYFLRSEADNTLMKKAGNLLTDFRIHRADIETKRRDQENQENYHVSITNSEDGLGNAEADFSLKEAESLHENSCFTSVKEAMEVLHYEPYGIFYDESREKVNVVKVTRDDSRWKEKPVQVKKQRWAYLDHIVPEGLFHELTVVVDAIPYRWESGKEFPVG